MLFNNVVKKYVCIRIKTRLLIIAIHSSDILFTYSLATWKYVMDASSSIIKAK